MKKTILTHAVVMDAVAALNINISPKSRIYPVPRGGIPIAYLLLAADTTLTIVDCFEDCDIVVDDVIDSGETRARYQGKPFCAAFGKRDFYAGNVAIGMQVEGWVVFPWESKDASSPDDDICRRLLQYIGEDVNRQGLLDTPKRFLKAWDFWTSGYNTDIAKLFTTFEDGAEKCDEMIIVRSIPIYSHCEHHLAAIFGEAHIGYIPNGKIVGLSKLARLADAFARRLQVQERLTNQIADAIEKYLEPVGVAVVVNARHFCMESRGVEKAGASTITSAMRGAFRDEASTRHEFLRLIGAP